MANTRTGRKEAVYAILDSGADRDYVGIDLARRLGLDMEQKEMEVAFVDATLMGTKEYCQPEPGEFIRFLPTGDS